MIHIAYVSKIAIKIDDPATSSMLILATFRAPNLSVKRPAGIEPIPVAPKYMPTMSPIFPRETSKSSLRTVAKNPGINPREAPIPTQAQQLAMIARSEDLVLSGTDIKRHVDHFI